MNCPNCQNADTKVLDSRPIEDGTAIRRRRECEKCAFRFSTYEQLEILDLNVIKKDGEKEPYSREKLERGIQRALEKREHTDATIRKLVSAVEREIQKKAKSGEIKSIEVGEIVMKKLKKTDKVAYIRFASVYRSFEDVDEFKQELKNL
ncbi:MAG: transcriptional regulator NrdR [Candidatus Doudnabacteria bacterium CG10_big_fil_rev_8_21_14_0_10_42_18]|uniref:Transcriptional repressor NrdR n=1 Tax=Candidatus Doudnabacteria bacterium CG10_big_fil_rev_8_21_14_0_10_42_18 TaxID=1974552 RepID=A0A2H0VC04_9BACT|nr:MAG: transcriptional regulator NrdR [Candidatus Doudnabacteria bacterium CG10_big_fil_rev_8_21_14_0_10_42_18]